VSQLFIFGSHVHMLLTGFSLYRIIYTMVKIRLRRVGAKNKPTYRVVVVESHTARNGAFIDTIGNFNPLTDPETFVIDAERAKHWLSHGAQPSATVSRLLSKAGIIEKKEYIVKKAAEEPKEKDERTS
jgi:small subunit ribosomal protein S16